MDLAHGFLAQHQQSLDELLATRVHEQRRLIAERRAEASDTSLVGAAGEPGRAARLRWMPRGWRHA